MFAKIKEKFQILLMGSVEDASERVHIQYLVVEAVLFGVSTFMTVLNIFTHWHRLGWVTGLFAVACVISFLFENFIEKMEIGRVVFAVAFVLMFSSFLALGEPEGFSALWILLVPASGFFLFRMKYGCIISGIQFIIIVFFLWTSVGRSFLQYQYTQSFIQRFPIIFVAFFIVGFMLNMIYVNAQNQLDKAKSEFEYMYNHDQLTGLYNRYGFNSSMDEYFSNRNGEACAFAIFDLDLFKRVNDQYGHVSGDIVLRETGRRTLEYFKDKAFVCRWGGEEFSLLFKDVQDIDLVERMCRDYLASFSAEPIDIEKAKLNISFSLGLVTVEKDQAIKLGHMVKIADSNLYDAKENGRNQVVACRYSEDIVIHE